MSSHLTTVVASESLIRKPILLKDYLLDDLSSCSSSGFRSYPRKQCCTATTVRFLLEIDLNRNRNKHYNSSSSSSKKQQQLLRKGGSKKSSAFQRASEAVINAVKHLPHFSASAKSPLPAPPNKHTRTILPRTLSRRLWKRSFWKKIDRESVEEKPKALPEFSSKTSAAAVTVTAIAADDDSNSSTTTSESNSSNSKSNSWSGSDFTASDIFNSCDNDAVAESKRRSPVKPVSMSVGVIVGKESTGATTSTKSSVETTKKDWPNEEDKQQFSPISVLDCPFDDDEEVSSPFRRRLICMKGTKQKLMQKIRRFENLSQFTPVDLEKRIALSESDQESVESPLQPCSVCPTQNNMALEDEEEEERKTEQKAVQLLQQMKATIPSDSFKFKADNILLDFFRQRITKGFIRTSECDVSNVAKDWMNGHPLELLKEWEVQKNRQAYIRDMERGDTWAKLDEDKEEVALELEAKVFTSLLDELLIDIFIS